MQHFDSAGVDIAFLDQGEGPAILLIHGFASSATVNWLNTGWVEALTGAGRRVVAIDNRGHGESAKLYDPAAYDLGVMAEDARRLLDHRGIASADLMGYSMGARIAASLALRAPKRVHALILGGMAGGLFADIDNRELVADALEAASLDAVADDAGRGFRRFAERTKSDRKALAACMRAPRTPIDPGALAALRLPILMAIGEKDDVAGSVDDFAKAVPQAEILIIPDRDHMTAVGDKAHKAGVLDFLARHGG